MSFLARGGKEGLQAVAAKLGIENVSSKIMIELKKEITSMDNYDEGFTKGLMEAVVAKQREEKELEKRRWEENKELRERIWKENMELEERRGKENKENMELRERIWQENRELRERIWQENTEARERIWKENREFEEIRRNVELEGIRRDMELEGIRRNEELEERRRNKELEERRRKENTDLEERRRKENIELEERRQKENSELEMKFELQVIRLENERILNRDNRDLINKFGTKPKLDSCDASGKGVPKYNDVLSSEKTEKANFIPEVSDVVSVESMQPSNVSVENMMHLQPECAVEVTQADDDSPVTQEEECFKSETSSDVLVELMDIAEPLTNQCVQLEGLVEVTADISHQPGVEKINIADELKPAGKLQLLPFVNDKASPRTVFLGETTFADSPGTQQSNNVPVADFKQAPRRRISSEVIKLHGKTITPYAPVSWSGGDGKTWNKGDSSHFKILKIDLRKWKISGKHQPDPGKISAIGKLKAPRTRAKLKSLLGLYNHYHDIPLYDEIAFPFTELRKEKAPEMLLWEDDHRIAFLHWKEKLPKTSGLHVLVLGKLLITHPDASEIGVGACSSRGEDEKIFPISFASQNSPKHRKVGRQSRGTHFLLSWRWRKWEPFLFGSRVKVIADHDLLYFVAGNTPQSSKLQPGALSLQKYDLQSLIVAEEN